MAMAWPDFRSCYTHIFIDIHVQHDAGQDKELNRCVGTQLLVIWKLWLWLWLLVFTSRKVCLRVESLLESQVKRKVFPAMVLPVLLYGAPEGWDIQSPNLSKATKAKSPSIKTSSHNKRTRLSYTHTLGCCFMDNGSRVMGKPRSRQRHGSRILAPTTNHFSCESWG